MIALRVVDFVIFVVSVIASLPRRAIFVRKSRIYTHRFDIIFPCGSAKKLGHGNDTKATV